jgi:hypothetical protein
MIKHMKLIPQIIATRIDRLHETIARAFSQGMMHRRYFVSVMIASVFSLIADVFSHGMMHRRYPMNVPPTLPKPKSARWLQELEKVLELEILSRDQYEADSAKYRAHMPYMRVIPDEHNHIRWISQLFSAYARKPNPKILPLSATADLAEAYVLCIRLEEDLIPRYETLIWTAEDDTTARVIDRILRETRMHYFMFSRALRMGGMMGHGRGMGRGRGRGRGMRRW